MALKILTDEVRARANSDAQFLNAARLWNFELLLRVGFDNYMMSISDGRISRFDITTDIFERYDIVLGGTEDDWEHLLTPVPPPFYQDFFGAFFQHGFQMSGDLDSMFAHYWALLRLLSIMRAAHHDGAGR